MSLNQFNCYNCNQTIIITGRKTKTSIKIELSDHNFYYCPKCNILACLNCWTSCRSCDLRCCNNCFKEHNVSQCKTCDKQTCNVITCELCQKGFCKDCTKKHFIKCKICKKKKCANTNETFSEQTCDTCELKCCADCMKEHILKIKICGICEGKTCVSTKCNGCNIIICKNCSKLHYQRCGECRKMHCSFVNCKICLAEICINCQPKHKITCFACSAITCKNKSSFREYYEKCNTCDNYVCYDCEKSNYNTCHCNPCSGYNNGVMMCKECIYKNHFKLCPLCNKSSVCHTGYCLHHGSTNCFICDNQLHQIGGISKYVYCFDCMYYRVAITGEKIDKAKINLCCQHENLTIPEIFKRIPFEKALTGDFHCCPICDTVTCKKHCKECKQCHHIFCSKENIKKCPICFEVKTNLNEYLIKELIGIVINYFSEKPL